MTTNNAVHLAEIEVTPQSTSLALGQTTQIKAVGVYSDGSYKDMTQSVTWTSKNADIVTVSSSGLASSLSVGQAVVSAASGSVTGTAQLTVGKAALLSLAITSPGSSLPLGGTEQATATGTYTDKSTQDVTNQVTWASSQPGVATIDPSGLISSKSAGNSTITATLNGIDASAQLSVSAAALASITVGENHSTIALGTTAQFTAQGVYTDGSTHDLTSTVTWTSSPGGVVALSSSGLATAKAVGTATVTATAGAISGTGQLTVAAAALTSIAVTSTKTSFPLGTTQQLTATGTYSDGTTHDLTSTVTWTSSPGGVVALSSAGLATGKAAGAATISATSNSVTGTAQLTVSSAALVSIAVTSSKSSIPLGTTQQLTATGTYTDSSTHDLTSTVTWTSSPGGVVAVSSAGLATGKAAGAATISATSNSVTGTAQLTVSSAALASIAVTSSKSSIPLGTTQQLTATGTYSDGSTQDLTSTVTWTATPAGVLAFSSSGLATAKAVGTATVHATSASVNGTGQLTVSAAELSALSIVSGKPNMPLGTTQQLTASGTFTDGSTQDLTAAVAWSSAANSVVSIDASGVATAKAQGSATVMAASHAINASTALTVSSADLSTISITPANPTVPMAGSQQLTATGTFTDGSTQDLTQSVTWNVDDPTIVSLSTGGVASAEKVGATEVEAAFGSTTGSTTLTVEPVASVGYFSTGNGDTAIRITNPGTTGQDLCAMTYVFDQDQQMAECCGCILSQDGLRTFSLNLDLIHNPLTGVAPLSGTVMFVTADHVSNPSCNPSTATPAGIGNAWGTHLQTLSQTQSALTEGAFSFTPLTPTLSSALQAQCSFIQQLGSGQGICSCGTGD